MKKNRLNYEASAYGKKLPVGVMLGILDQDEFEMSMDHMLEGLLQAELLPASQKLLDAKVKKYREKYGS